MSRLPNIRVFSLDSIDQLAESIRPQREHFTLLLAWDATTSEMTELMRWMRPIVDRGLVYFCVWGERCEAVHDAVDKCDIERGLNPDEPGCFVMTTWHHDESLDEACWFFEHCVSPTGVRSFDWFAVAIGHPEWAESMSRCFFPSKA